MADVRLAHTADLDADTRVAVRDLLHAAFGGEFADDDWEHSLGGMHATAWEGPLLVGHASLVQRRLLHGDRALRAGYVEGVGVRPDRRGRGYGGALMTALERLIRGAYDLGALASSEMAVGFYERRGWLRWPGPTAVLAPDGIRRTEEEDGAVYVLPVRAGLEPSGQLACDWRDGDVW